MSMSLARRLVLVVVLALVGVGAATAAAFRAHQESDAARDSTAIAQAQYMAQELRAKRDALPPAVAEAIARGGPAPQTLRAFTATLLAPLTDASAGYCLRDGTLAVRETIVTSVSASDLSFPLPGQRPPHADEGLRGNVHAPRGLGLLPLDRDVVVAACRDPKRRAQGSLRFVAPRDTLFVALAGGHEPFAAWALVRTPKRAHSQDVLASPYLVGAIVLAMIALVGLCIDTLLQIRRGIGTIANALVAVQADLETSIPRPAPRELAQIADGLRAMTAHLSDSRKRELALERRLSHERRLASLGRVAAGVAHEIRNPLASIKLRLDAMARRKLDERSAHDVTRALGEVARLDNVVSSLLLVARKQPTPLADVDLAALVDERLAALEAFASTRAVRIVRDGAARAHIDPSGMSRVIDNLVRNSVEASPDGAQVVVELRTCEADLVLRVVDVGPGVSALQQSELFEPFFTSKPDGTGLGLSLSRAAVEAHGGTLTYGRAGGTTSFTVRVPSKANSI
jgi:signal transduction histidine kinase